MTPETVILTGIVAGVLTGRWTMKRKVKEIERREVTDPLTGLTNRLGLTRHLVERTTAASPYALLLLDLDGFKEVNDTYGHRAGDALLAEVGQRLRSIRPGSGIVARLGGDEFVVVAGVHADVASLAHQVLDVLAEPVSLPEVDVPVGASIGVAFGAAGAKARDVLHAADEAMYSAKRSGSQVAYSKGARHWLEEAPTVRIRDIRGGMPEPDALGRGCVLGPPEALV